MFIQKVRNIKRLLPLLTALLLLTGIGAQAQSDLGWIGVKIERWPARPWADGSYTGVTDTRFGKGALVKAVETGSPAEKAGIEVGDIILKFDGKAIQVGLEDLILTGYIRATQPGITKVVEIWRSGERNREVAIVVAKDPNPIQPRQQSKAERQAWVTYQKRGQSIVEQTLNYSTTGSLDGTWKYYWEADKNQKCVAKVKFASRGDAEFSAEFPHLGDDGSYTFYPPLLHTCVGENCVRAIDIRWFNATAFKISRIVDSTRRHRIVAYEFTDGQVSLATSENNLATPDAVPDHRRLQNAWGLAFAACPGKKSAF